MKYGLIILFLGVLIATAAVRNGGWWLVLFWPAISFAVIGIAYFFRQHRVFGKSQNGSMNLISVIFLLPFLVYVWFIWHLIRLISREPAFHQLSKDVFIGRRLLAREIPLETRTVVDLTCEFPESKAILGQCNYLSIPILDASTRRPHELVEWVARISTAETPIFIHCAQGHGRTGLIASLLMIATEQANDADSALALVQSVRPHIKLNSAQRNVLNDAAMLLVR